MPHTAQHDIYMKSCESERSTKTEILLDENENSQTPAMMPDVIPGAGDNDDMTSTVTPDRDQNLNGGNATKPSSSDHVGDTVVTTEIPLDEPATSADEIPEVFIYHSDERKRYVSYETVPATGSQLAKRNACRPDACCHYL